MIDKSSSRAILAGRGCCFFSESRGSGRIAWADIRSRSLLAKSPPQERGEGPFELESERKLKINLNGQVWIKTGATVTHTGQIQFRREGMLERGIGQMLKRALCGESRRLTKAEGSGQLFLADQGKRISILHLHDDAVHVEGKDVLAFEPEIDWDVEPLRKLAGFLSGRSFAVRLQRPRPGRPLPRSTTRSRCG